MNMRLIELLAMTILLVGSATAQCSASIDNCYDCLTAGDGNTCSFCQKYQGQSFCTSATSAGAALDGDGNPCTEVTADGSDIFKPAGNLLGCIGGTCSGVDPGCEFCEPIFKYGCRYCLDSGCVRNTTCANKPNVAEPFTCSNKPCNAREGCNECLAGGGTTCYFCAKSSDLSDGQCQSSATCSGNTYTQSLSNSSFCPTFERDAGSLLTPAFGLVFGLVAALAAFAF